MRVPWWLALGALTALSGCPEDRDPPPAQGSTSAGASSTSGDGGSFVMQPDVGGGGTTGPAWPLPTDDDLLTCVRSCEGPWDCCPPGTEGMCPGPNYPYNYMCIQEMCVFPPCTADSDCTGDGEQCLEVDGWPTCVVPCEGDDACAAIDTELSCSRTADDGTSYCVALCTNPGVFCGIASCDEASGACVCSSDGQCQVDWVCV